MQEDRRGQQLGLHVLHEAIGDGAMGRVYRAEHAQSGATVAIKVLHPGVAADEVAVERFRREYQTAKALQHPAIVEVLEFSETEDGSYCMTMECLEGEELGARIEREGPLPPASLVRLICQVSLALEFAHDRGVVHRDLKPGNLFLCRSDDGDQLRILDFGSVKLESSPGAKLTAIGTTVGSPCYMSPEQARGETDLDRRTDVFAMAAILHEAATGQVAFGAPSVGEILERILEDEPPPVSLLNPDYPWSFDDVIKRALRKDKARRFFGANELAEAVLQSFGLSKEVERWASAPRAEVEAGINAPDNPGVPVTAHEPSSLPETALEAAARRVTESSDDDVMPPLPERKRSTAAWILTALALSTGGALWFFSSFLR